MGALSKFIRLIMSTLEEIASLSGVSRSTVSRVINDDPHVKEVTRERVLKIVQDLNYQPNMAARSLAVSRTNILGLVIPTGISSLFTDPYFPIFIHGVSSACNAKNHSVMLWLAEPEYERRTIRQVLHNGFVAGVIVSSMLLDDPLVEALLEANFPFVLVGRHLSNTNVSYVDVDNRKSAQDIVTHLLRVGHQRIAHISGPLNIVSGLDRQEGYLTALRSRGATVDPQLIVEADFTEDGAALAMQRLLPRKPQAVFAASDAMAVGAMRIIRDAGLRIPDDIAVVGFDDLPFAERHLPSLTTIRQPIHQMGEMAVKTLLELLEHPDMGPQRVILPTQLMIRESCGAHLV